MGISAGFFIFCLRTLLESANCFCHWEGIAGLFISKKMLNITPGANDTLAFLFKNFIRDGSYVAIACPCALVLLPASSSLLQGTD